MKLLSIVFTSNTIEITNYFMITILLLSFGFAVFIALLISLQTIRNEKLAKALIITIVCYLIWNLGYLFELISVTLQIKLVWFTFQQIGRLLLPTAWLSMMLIFSEKDDYVKHIRFLGILFAVVSFIIILTTKNSGLFISNPEIISHENLNVLSFQTGLWFIVVNIFRNVYFIVSLLLGLLRLITSDRHSVNFVVIIDVLIVYLFLLELLNHLGLYLIPDVNNILLLSFMTGLVALVIINREHYISLVPFAYRLLVESLSDAIVILSNEKEVVSFNSPAEKIFGEMTWNLVFDKVNRNILEDITLKDEIEDLFAKSKKFHFLIDEKYQKTYYDFTISKVKKDNEQLGYILQFRDVSHHFNSYHTIKQIAETDALTGVMNRTSFAMIFSRIYEQAKQEGATFSTAILDINNFKEINDTHGHVVGDEVLKMLGSICLNNIRKTDLLVRFGGDEFVIVLPNIENDTMNRICENILEKFQSEIEKKIDKLDKASFSYGIYTYDPTVTTEEVSLEKFLDLADQNMYENKKTKTIESKKLKKSTK